MNGTIITPCATQGYKGMARLVLHATRHTCVTQGNNEMVGLLLHVTHVLHRVIKVKARLMLMSPMNCTGLSIPWHTFGEQGNNGVAGLLLHVHMCK